MIGQLSIHPRNWKSIGNGETKNTCAALHIASLKLSPYEHAALAAVAVNRLAAGTLLSLARSDCRYADPSPEQKERIQQLLARELGNTEEVIQAAAERFMSGGRVQ